MKTGSFFCLFYLLALNSVYANTFTTKVIESTVPVIIDGNWLYPEDGKYTIIMTDSNLTVNGYEYVHPEDKSKSKLIPPTKEEKYFEWIIYTTVEHAYELIDSGRTSDEVKRYMKKMFDQYSDGKGFWYSYDDYGNFKVYGAENSAVIVRIPSRPREKKTISYRDRVVEMRFKELCYYLQNGYLIMRGSRSSDFRVFPPNEIKDIMVELKNIQKEMKLQSNDNVMNYPTIIVAKKYKLSRSEVKVLIHPLEPIGK